MAQAPSLATVFGRAKTIEQVSISPDGQRLAIIGSDGRGGLLSIATVDTDEVKHLKFGPVEPLGVTWVGNDHLVVRIAAVLKVDEHRYRFVRNILVTADGQLGPISPNRLAAHVRAPILLIEAEDDPYGGAGQSEFMADALTRAGKPFERVVLRDTGRRLNTTAALTQMLEVLDVFLAKALPVTGVADVTH